MFRDQSYFINNNELSPDAQNTNDSRFPRMTVSIDFYNMAFGTAAATPGSPFTDMDLL